MPKSHLHDFLETFDYYHLLVGDLLKELPECSTNTIAARLAKLQEELTTKRSKCDSKDWEEVAVYFASCTAATTEGLARVKGQKSETRRHMSIYESLVQSLTTGMLINKSPSGMLDTIERLKSAVALCKQKLKLVKPL